MKKSTFHRILLSGILLLFAGTFSACKKEDLNKSNNSVQVAIVKATVSPSMPDNENKNVILEGVFVSDVEFDVAEFGAILYNDITQLAQGEQIGVISEKRTKPGSFTISFKVPIGENRFIKLFAKSSSGIIYSGNIQHIDELMKKEVIQISGGGYTYFPGSSIMFSTVTTLSLSITNLSSQSMTINSITATSAGDYYVQFPTLTPPQDLPNSGSTFNFNLNQLKPNSGTLTINTSLGTFDFPLFYSAPPPQFQFRHQGGTNIADGSNISINATTLNVQLEAFNAGVVDYTLHGNTIGNGSFVSTLTASTIVSPATSSPITISYTGSKLSDMCTYTLHTSIGDHSYVFDYNSGLSVQDTNFTVFENGQTIPATFGQHLNITLNNNSGQTVNFNAGDIQTGGLNLINSPISIADGNSGVVTIDVNASFGSMSVLWFGKTYTFSIATP